MIVTNSEMQCFRRCAREHRHRYVDRVEPLIPAEALVRGRKAHDVLAGWWVGHTIGTYDCIENLGPSTPADRAMLRGYDARYQRPHLVDVRVNVPFAVDLGTVTLVGELDAIGTDPETGKTVIVEHKTTSSDITPGSNYWREVVLTAAQPSAYLRASPEATVLWDALRKPALRKLRAGKPNEETDAEFEARCLEAMSEDPGKYFQRANVVRLEDEHRAFEEDVVATASLISETVEAPRNSDSCWQFGRPCDYFGVCWEGRSLDSTEFVKREKNHTEKIADRL